MKRVLAWLVGLVCVLVACSDAPPASMRLERSRQALEWTFETVLARDDVANQSNAVAISGDTVVVGASRNNGARGAADVYRRGSDGTWAHEAQLDLPFDSLGAFGLRVKIAGERLLVTSYAGVCVFERIGRTWTLAQLLAPAVTPGKNAPDIDADLSGDTIVVESAQFVDPSSADHSRMGAIAVYERDEATGAFVATMLPMPEPLTEPPPFDGRLSVDGDTFAYGNGLHVFLYRRVTRGEWKLEATLEPTHPNPQLFGYSLALRGGELMVGSYDGVQVDVFRRTGVAWSNVARLAPEEEIPVSTFGAEVALSGDEGVAGDPLRERGAGAIFRLHRDNGEWRVIGPVPSRGAMAGANLGLVVAMDGNTIVAGAPGHPPHGATFTFRVAQGLGDACRDDLACGSGHCVDGVCCDDVCGGGKTGDCTSCNLPGMLGHCAVAPAETVCRPSLGACDVEERCSGASALCGPDDVVPDGTICEGGRCSAGACRAEPAPDGGTSVTTAPAVRPSYEVGGGGCSFVPARSRSDLLGAIVFTLAALAVVRRRLRVLALVALALAFVPRAPVELVAGRLHARIGSPTTLHDDASGARWAMGLEGIGRSEYRTIPEARRIQRDGARATIARGDVDEWFEVNEKGLEHGAVVRVREAGSGPLHLRVRMSAEGESLESTPLGVRVGALAYSHLEVRDATERRLAAALHPRDARTLDITIDDSNAVYPLVIDPQVWLEEQRIDAPEDVPGGSFGDTFAVFGDRLFVVRPNAHATVFVHHRDGAQWVPDAELRPSHDEAGFGLGIAVAEDMAVVSAITAHDGGELFVFERDPATNSWKETADLREPEPTGTDLLGFSLALSATPDSYVLLAGAPFYDPIDADYSHGAVHVFTRPRGGGEWTYEGAIRGAEDDLFFGEAIAQDGEHLAISAVSVVFTLRPPNPATVHFYEGPPLAWEEIQVLRSPTALAYSFFGHALALQGDTALIGAPGLFGAFTTQGSIHVYELRDGAWEFAQKVTQEALVRDEMAEDGLGQLLVLDGDRLLTNGVGTGGSSPQGFLFERGPDHRFHQSRTFEAPTKDEARTFAVAMGFSRDQILIGAPGYDRDVGAVRVYTLSELGQACSGASSCASGHCVDGVCCESACNDGDPNDCLACSVAAGAPDDGMCRPVAALHVCRPATSECDLAEVCDGTSAVCPADVVALNGATCANGTCAGGKCQAAVAPPVSAVDAGGPSPVVTASPPAGSSCSFATRRSSGGGATLFGLGLGLALAVLALVRRRR